MVNYKLAQKNMPAYCLIFFKTVRGYEFWLKIETSLAKRVCGRGRFKSHAALLIGFVRFGVRLH